MNLPHSSISHLLPKDYYSIELFGTREFTETNNWQTLAHLARAGSTSSTLQPPLLCLVPLQVQRDKASYMKTNENCLPDFSILMAKPTRDFLKLA